jgi:triacylglycerol lipase
VGVIRSTTALVCALAALLVPASPASADPALSVPKAQLDAALRCVAPVGTANGSEPVLLVHGTGTNPEENWSWNYGKVLPEKGWDVCTVTLPNRALEDIQVASEYVVHALVTIAERYGRKVDVIGHSQGGLEPRWAVRWWEAARAAVDDLVTLASPNHGTVAADTACVRACSAAVHQMKQGSKFLTALNEGDETPGAISYTSIYSLTDELVQPAVPTPTAALDGASNVAIQDLCPGRVGEHALMAADAVAYALAVDAFTNPGPADPARIPVTTCLQTSFEGVSSTAALELGFEHLPRQRFPDYRELPEEPELAPYARPAAAPGPPGAQPGDGTPAPTAGSPAPPPPAAAVPVEAQQELPRTGGGVPAMLLPLLLAAAGAAGIAVPRRL